MELKQALNSDPWQFDGLNFTQFKAKCKELGIKGVTPAKVIEIFSPCENEGFYHYPVGDLIIEMSDTSVWESDHKRKSKQYGFSVM